MSRILSMNEQYIKTLDENFLYENLINYCEEYKQKIPEGKKENIRSSLSFLKNKAKTLEDIFNNLKYIIIDKVSITQEDLKILDETAKKIIKEFRNKIENLSEFERNKLEPIVNDLIANHNTNFKGVGQPLRLVLTGSKFGPGIYDILLSLGKAEVLNRLSNKIT